MVNFKVVFAIFAALATSLPTTIENVEVEKSLEARQVCVVTCGSTCYWQEDINEAVAEAYRLYKAGRTVGSNSYPHTFNNREGLSFSVSGPYQEFPILSSYNVYTGGSPGPDRVVINTGGSYGGSITHTGASGNNFVKCKS